MKYNLSKISHFFKAEKARVLAILIAALAIRLYFSFITKKEVAGDQHTYDAIAMFLLKYRSFMIAEGTPTAYITPLYPLFMAGVYACFGHSYLWMRIIQAVIGTFSCLVVYLIAKEAFDKRVALLSLLLASLHYFFISYGTLLNSESLFMFFLALSVLFLLKLCKSGSFVDAALFGLFSSFTVLTRSAHFLFIFLAVALLLLLPKLSGILYKKIFKLLIVAFACFIIPISAWTLRNYLVFKSFIPLGTEAGIVLYSAYNPVNGKILDMWTRDAVVANAATMSEVDGYRYLTKQAVLSIKKDHSKIYKYIPLRLMYFFSVFDWLAFDKDGEDIQGAYNFSTAFILPLFFLGVFTAWFKKRSPPIFIVLLPVAYYIFIAMAVMGIPRTRLPVEPYMIIFAAFFMLYVYDLTRAKFLAAGIFVFWYFLNYIFFLNSSAVKAVARDFFIKIKLW